MAGFFPPVFPHFIARFELGAHHHLSGLLYTVKLKLRAALPLFDPFVPAASTNHLPTETPTQNVRSSELIEPPPKRIDLLCTYHPFPLQVALSNQLSEGNSSCVAPPLLNGNSAIITPQNVLSLLPLSSLALCSLRTPYPCSQRPFSVTRSPSLSL